MVPEICDTCGCEVKRVDGNLGSGDDTLMLNDYLTMTDWYQNNRPTWFKIKGPNPYACRRCIKMLTEAGMEDFIGGDADKFLITQEWWI